MSGPASSGRYLALALNGNCAIGPNTWQCASTAPGGGVKRGLLGAGCQLVILSVINSPTSSLRAQRSNPSPAIAQQESAGDGLPRRLRLLAMTRSGLKHTPCHPSACARCAAARLFDLPGIERHHAGHFPARMFDAERLHIALRHRGHFGSGRSFDQAGRRRRHRAEHADAGVGAVGNEHPRGQRAAMLRAGQPVSSSAPISR